MSKQSINAAIRKAKIRDDYTCLVCGRGHSTRHTVNGSHLLPRRNPFKLSRPDDPDQIMTLCWKCDQGKGGYDTIHSVDGKIKWLIAKGIRVKIFLERLKKITGRD